MTSLLTKIKSLDTQVSTNTENISNKQSTLTSTSNITTGTISSGNITAPTITASTNLLYGSNNVGTKIGQLETNKQNTLTTTTDLTLRVFTCSSIISGGVNLNTSLNGKQSTLNSTTTNIITGTIDSGNITGRTGTTITAPTITASGNLLYGTTNVATKISDIETSLNTKQPTLTASTNINTGTITSGNIIGRDTASFSAQTIKAGINLLYGTTNVGTKIGQLETALNETAKLTLANVFTTS